jgi:hypothetical protein
MKTDSQRKAAYEARMLSTLLDPTGAAVVAKAVTNFNTYVDDFVPKQAQLRVILDGAGLSSFLYAGFEAFFGELYHLSKVTSGPGLVANAVPLIIKWSSAAKLGTGNLSVLKSIALDIFNIIYPTP